jgi:xylulokinase
LQQDIKSKMGKEYILASDFGTSGCKTVLVDKSGLVVCAAMSEYPMYMPYPGWFEQDPQTWLQALGITVKAVLEKSGVLRTDIVAMGIDGVTHNVVLLDKNDQPLRRCIVFFDTRSSLEAEESYKKWGQEIFRRTSNGISSIWTWPQLSWIKHHQADIWAKARTILCQKDFIRNYIAPSRVTDFIDAEGTLLFDPFENAWIEEFIDDLDLPLSVFPEVVDPKKVVGRIDQQGAKLTGLAIGTPVITGTTDTVAEVLGAGAVRPGQGTVKLASVGRISSISTAPINHLKLLNYRHVIDDLWYPGTATKFATSAYRWLRQTVWNNASYDEMSVAAESAPAGCNGLLFHPHLDGEWVPYWDDKLRGDFLGITLRHSREHLTRAVMEGVAIALRSGLEYIASLNLSFNDIRLIGQGVRGKVWRQIIADCLNRKITITAERDAAFGIALLTGIGIGLYPGAPDQIEKLVHIEEEVNPDQEAVEIYNSLYSIYQESDAALKTISHQLSDFEYKRAEGKNIQACQSEKTDPSKFLLIS